MVRSLSLGNEKLTSKTVATEQKYRNIYIYIETYFARFNFLVTRTYISEQFSVLISVEKLLWLSDDTACEERKSVS